jgi:putative ABC transport system permease protein
MITELFLTAFKSLASNKTRTFLTMLGVIIGVFAVITLISIGEGIQNFVTQRFNSLGSNLIFVVPGRINFRDDPGAGYATNKLTKKHYNLIDTYISDVVSDLTPLYEIGKSLTYKNKNYYSVLNCTNENGDKAYNVEIAEGRYFSRNDVLSSSRVVVIGHEVRNELFSNQDPIGKTLKIDDKTFTIIGVAKEKGGAMDQRSYVPYTTAEHIFNSTRYSGIVMKAKSPELVDSAIKRIEQALLRDLEEDDFTVLSQKDILNSFTSILSTITIGIGAIAAISLLVGGIGIMNIMLVTVTERTREIGLRKAVGASPFNIALQFLLEATSLSILGGAIGVILALITTTIVRLNFNFDATVPLWALLLAFIFSAMVGILFGTYPAVKASKKDPIEALRYE